MHRSTFDKFARQAESLSVADLDRRIENVDYYLSMGFETDELISKRLALIAERHCR